MMRTAGRRAGNTIQLAGVLAMLTVLAGPGYEPAAVAQGTGSTPQSTDSLRARSAEKVLVCHRAGRRWVPLTVPQRAAERHVDHGDFLYDPSAGECCTAADCIAGQSCRHLVGLADETLLGVCRVPQAGTGTDPRGVLLALGVFGTASGVASPFTGFLSRDAANNYSLSFTVNGIGAQVQLAHVEPKDGPPLAEDSAMPVTVTFPPRNSGLITFDYTANYLNLIFTVTAPSVWGTGTVNMDNATVVRFSLDIDPTDLDSLPIVFPDDDGAYGVLGIRGVYVQPTIYIGDGNGRGGFYPGLLYGTITAQVLVFMGAVYDVAL